MASVFFVFFFPLFSCFISFCLMCLVRMLLSIFVILLFFRFFFAKRTITPSRLTFKIYSDGNSIHWSKCAHFHAFSHSRNENVGCRDYSGQKAQNVPKVKNKCARCAQRKSTSSRKMIKNSHNFGVVWGLKHVIASNICFALCECARALTR